MTYIQGLRRSINFSSKARKLREEFRRQAEERNAYGELIAVGREDKDPATEELPDDKGEIE